MRRMLSDAQVRYLRNKQDKLIAGDNITISNDNVISATVPSATLQLCIQCTDAANTPKNITWEKPGVSPITITGTLVAGEDTLSQLYVINEVGQDRIFATVKYWAEGAGEYLYKWQLISIING